MAASLAAAAATTFAVRTAAALTSPPTPLPPSPSLPPQPSPPRSLTPPTANARRRYHRHPTAAAAVDNRQPQSCCCIIKKYLSFSIRDYRVTSRATYMRAHYLTEFVERAHHPSVRQPLSFARASHATCESSRPLPPTLSSTARPCVPSAPASRTSRSARPGLQPRALCSRGPHEGGAAGRAVDEDTCCVAPCDARDLQARLGVVVRLARVRPLLPLLVDASTTIAITSA
jgi:hypothetical protein